MDKGSNKNLPAVSQKNTSGVSHIFGTDIFDILDSKPISDTDIEANISYIDDKLELFSNMKEHFDAVPNLKNILSLYMILYDHSEDKKKLKNIIKKQLISAGVYSDEELLEFCLLISEKKRSFEDCPSQGSDEEIGKYYFAKYASQEKRASKDFNFYLKNTHSRQIEKKRIIEETVLKMIAQNRGHLSKVISSPAPEITKAIHDADTYFQKAFFGFFQKHAPVSLIKVTHMTNEYTEHADRVSGNTFIDQKNFYRDADKFIHYVIHEGMHLCFEGFNEHSIEEGLIEYYIQKMYLLNPPKKFSYSPVSEIYSEWRDYFTELFYMFPELENHFTTYFLTGDKSGLQVYIAKTFDDATIERIEKSYYSSGFSRFLEAMKRIA